MLTGSPDFSPYRPPFFVAFPLLVRIFRSSALIKSLVQAGSLINLRHLQFAALSIKLKYPKSLTAFCVYHNQFSRCISYSNLNSQRVFFYFATNTGLIFSPNKNHKYNLPAIILPVNTLISVILSRVINYVVVVVFFL